MRRPWVDIQLLQDLETVRKAVEEATISVHRISAANSVNILTGGALKPWTDDQMDFIEQERILPIIKAANVLPRPPEASDER